MMISYECIGPVMILALEALLAISADRVHMQVHLQLQNKHNVKDCFFDNGEFCCGIT